MLTDQQYNKVIGFIKKNNLIETDYKLEYIESKLKIERLNKKRCSCIYNDIQNYINYFYEK